MRWLVAKGRVIVKLNVPDTRASLLLRLPNTGDAAAWDEFVAIYQPLVYRVARGQGLQDSDAQDLVQEVLVAVSRAADRWVPDPERGRFRAWLFRITRNLIINFLTRRKHQSLATGGLECAESLDGLRAPAADVSATLDWEYRREIFAWAAEQVRQQVKPETWQAFWRTGVQQEPVVDVAQSLRMSVGAVYIARSRVMARLQAIVSAWKTAQEQSGELP